ncbi:hypothetical protein AB8879_09980 [Alphaproteobacteria bacterium LSUCC0744]
MTLSKKHKHLLTRIKSGEFVYPQSKVWHTLFRLIKHNVPKDTDVPNPLILGGSGANDYSKNQRLQEHLRIAKEHDLLNSALGLLCEVPEENWVVSNGNLDPNEPTYWELEEQYQNELQSKWFFKPKENDEVNLATIDETKPGRIMFSNENGWVFDVIEYPDDKTAEQKLRLNGFKRCNEEKNFRALYSIPDNLLEVLPDGNDGLYSSGKHWRESC